MFRLAYVSLAATPDPEVRDLADILAVSDRNNRRARLTGGLLISRARFFQVLEGDQREVERAFARIREDERHMAVTIVWAGPAAGRLFDGWAMVAATITPTNRLNIARVIDEAGDYPHAAISSLHHLVLAQRVG